MRLVGTVGTHEDAHVLHQTENLREHPTGPPVTSHLAALSLAGISAEVQVTGTLTFLNISAPLRASSRAMSCGVDTMTAPESTDAPCFASTLKNLS